MRLIIAGFAAALLISPLSSPVRAIETIGIAPEKEFSGAKQPRMAVDPSGKIYLVFGSNEEIYCARSEDGGQHYDRPTKVGEAGILALGMRRGPSVAASDKFVVVTAVCGQQGHGRDGDLLAWRSENGGRNWAGPVTVNGLPAAAREGLHQLAVSPAGEFYCVWLDLRAKKTQLYGASSSDNGRSWRERLIYASPDGSVCQCCEPQVAYDCKGGLHVMWRNSLAGKRDMYLVNSHDDGVSFDVAAKMGDGTWPLNACPMDGGGLACDANGQVTTVWRREKEVFCCIPGQHEISLGEGSQPWAASGPGGVFLVWSERQTGSVMSSTPKSDKLFVVAEKGFDPVIAAPSNGEGPVIAAWEADGPYRIQTAIIAKRRQVAASPDSPAP